MNYFEKLKQVVLDNSYAKTYAEATTEWVTTYYDTCDSDICVCGKCGLKNRYEITNVKTGAILFPIGSECIEKFDNEKMSHEAVTLKQIAECRDSFMKFQPFNLKTINPDIINYCYGQDVFEDEQDYNFALMLSRKHSFHMYSDRQMRKINYLLDKIENAIIFDNSFYNNPKELGKEKIQRKEFMDKTGKYIKADDIPPLVMIHLPENIFSDPGHKSFMLSIYRRIKRKEYVTEKQIHFFNSLLVKNVIPYLKGEKIT